MQGVADLNQRIVDSGKVSACLARQYVTYALRREPGDATGDEALQDDLRVATACGACRDCACAVFEESRVAGGSPCARGMAAATQALLAA